MKKLYILIPALLVISLTSMMLVEKNDNQPTNSFTYEENMSSFHKGMITIKVKAGIKNLDNQKGNVSFNIRSLDLTATRYKIDLLEKRFKYNPKKMKKGMPDLSRIYRIEFPEEYSVTKVAREFSKDPNIEYAEPIPINYFCEVPNDSLYSQMNHLPQIKADSAWDIHKGEDGEEEVVIAIVDSGVDWDHEDLVDNIWQNMGEDVDDDGKTIEFLDGEWIFDPDDENGLDDDGNGFIDDFIGWNFLTSSNDPNPTLGFLFYFHGTHTAGLASATTNNNIGIASIGWNLKIMPIDNGIDSSYHTAFDAIIYAAELGADVISNSWTSHFYAQANHEAITYSIGLGSIIVGAAGNFSKFSNYYPADYPGVVSVAAVSNNDQKAGFSNFGPNIWICTPGDGVLSAVPNDNYAYGFGTSMATPIAAGLLGLVKSYHPEWSPYQVIKQVLATADDIDQINPGFENLLGSGRINAYHALKDTGVSLAQEISIDLLHSAYHDTDSNHMLEPGDTATFSFKLRNYNFGVGVDSALFTLASSDPDIIILNDSYVTSVPADDYFSLENVFKIMIADQTSFHMANINIITHADVDITWGDTISVEVPVAPQGILVYQGEGSGDAFSGDFINEFLIEQGLQVVYTSHFPFSLKGFDAAFLSYGNYGWRINDGVIVTLEMVEAIVEYAEDGGKLYLECGSLFSSNYYFGYPNADEIMELFGVEEYESSLSSNPINSLTGLTGSICEGLAFGGSTQDPDWYINTMTPNENGVAVFEEDDYGTVAVQGEGEYGQKTFCFSYALAHLVDNDLGSRDTLLNRIVEYFDLYNPKADFMADNTFVEEGDTIYFTDLSDNNPVSWEWQFEGGTPETSSEQNPVVIYNLPGTFDVTLIVTNEYGSDTLTIEDYITVDPETGIIAQDINHVVIFPNPINSEPRIEFYLEMNIPVQLSILDIHGRVITELQTEELQSGKNQLTWNAKNISSGIYFCRLKIGNEIITRKVIKIE